MNVKLDELDVDESDELAVEKCFVRNGYLFISLFTLTLGLSQRTRGVEPEAPKRSRFFGLASILV